VDLLPRRVIRRKALPMVSAVLLVGAVSVAAAYASAGTTTTSPSLAAEKPFLAANDTAMNKMMAGMAIRPSGDIDHDFVAMMIPHHQGAIDMAQAELRYGRNQPLQRIAQEIVVEELQEIAAMQLAVGDKVSPSAALLAASTPAAAAQPHRSSANPGGTNSRLLAGEQPFLAENDTAMSKMMADMTIRPSGDIERDFVAMMIPHHQGAIDMAQAELRHGHNAQLRLIAQEIIVDQIQQISLMRFAVGETLPPPISSPTAPSPAPAPQSGMQMPPDMMNMK
jgi:uncharacterized protein (DUF305 family)